MGIVLANCLSMAYQTSPDTYKDVGSSISALIDWSYYDMEQSILEIPKLIQVYLARNYHNPIVESEVKAVQFKRP